jgi:hypothetical protein
MVAIILVVGVRRELVKKEGGSRSYKKDNDGQCVVLFLVLHLNSSCFWSMLNLLSLKCMT